MAMASPDTMPRALGFCLFDTAIGPCGLAWGDAGIVGVQLPEADESATRRRMRRRFPGVPEAAPGPAAAGAATRIAALLRGEPDDLCTVELDMRGIGEFQQRVYALVRAIPPGETLTYGEVAARLGVPGAARAVGKAMGDNPFAPVVPCHRVLAAQGGAGGFSAEGGVRTKLRMLSIEGARFGAQPGLFDH